MEALLSPKITLSKINEQTNGKETALNCLKGDFYFGLFLAY
jgi:hypothetical protein